jgi:hypothetical protein
MYCSKHSKAFRITATNPNAAAVTNYRPNPNDEQVLGKNLQEEPGSPNAKGDSDRKLGSPVITSR